MKYTCMFDENVVEMCRVGLNQTIISYKADLRKEK